ncbi:hypothetical protein CHLRE_04g217983v5 [Chlamydomonas reinhardtii]|uniref:Uncharacterized protein n=1 Tax=Chlamydomonas reinhardtii TaxID=3055 RepID=A0A2K3DTN1_CHLRE|nr:uncharacterized protein CHLRE_04g217983v5 [Chlamydomonas reinhardtii]PNW83887.1 hypothetical protein CHLRE_04g217983v5 [Chlamydomonas reinhardtii]
MHLDVLMLLGGLAPSRLVLQACWRRGWGWGLGADSTNRITTCDATWAHPRQGTPQ